MSGLVEALTEVASAAQTEPMAFLAGFDDKTHLGELLAVINSFPAEAATGHMKVAGFVPKTKNRANACRFVALTLLYATQIVFEGRNKGLGNFQSAVYARLETRENFFESDLTLMRGFRGLAQLALSDSDACHLSQFASLAWHAFPPDQRKAGAIGATYVLLERMGQSWPS